MSLPSSPFPAPIVSSFLAGPSVADLSSQALISILLLEQSSTVLIGEEDADELRESTPTAAELRARLVQLVNETLAEGGLPAGKSEDELLAAIDRGGKSQCGQAGRFWTCDPIDGTSEPQGL